MSRWRQTLDREAAGRRDDIVRLEKRLGLKHRVSDSLEEEKDYWEWLRDEALVGNPAIDQRGIGYRHMSINELEAAIERAEIRHEHSGLEGDWQTLEALEAALAYKREAMYRRDRGESLDYAQQETLRRVNPDDDKIIHKKLPPGTELSRGGYSTLSIWGTRMAVVEGPTHRSTDEHEFDPNTISYRLTVFLSNVPADPRLVSTSIDFPRGDKTLYEQPFYYQTRHGMGRNTGQLGEPFFYWVEFPKFSDLSPGQSASVVRALQRKGYIEPSSRYTLTAAKWKKLLGMSFDETQALDDYDLLNAADEVGSFRWSTFPGVFAVNKKGTIKYIVSRAPKGTGL